MKVIGIATGSGSKTGTDRDLLSALSGTQADRDRGIAFRTRRVVRTSCGVLQEQKAGRRRSRSVALASILLVALAMGPFVWRVADDVVGGARWEDLATQVSIWIGIFFLAVLAASLVAGWMRGKS
ncbi:MAG TPA: hypothetical protein VHX20_14840 [Terracidiphilus sp.]|nr:hypothetical protein [Terracidiphilus sp.]